MENINGRYRVLAKSYGGSVSQEQRLLLEKEGKIRNFLFGSASKENTSNANTKEDNITAKRKAIPNTVPTWKRKKRKIQEEQSRGEVLLESVIDLQQKEILEESVEEAERYNIDILSKSTKLKNNFNLKKKHVDEHDDDIEDQSYHCEQLKGLRLVIQAYSTCEGEAAYLLLNDIKPKLERICCCIFLELQSKMQERS